MFEMFYGPIVLAGIELIPFGYKNYKNQVNFYYRLLLIHQSCKIAII